MHIYGSENGRSTIKKPGFFVLKKPVFVPMSKPSSLPLFHFLFNNMSILSSLVYKDADKAASFINQLSQVYRYLLDNKNNELVTLNNELTFIKSYTYLLQLRFDKSIAFDFDIPENTLTHSIPPMSLQMLIENAIKHNEVSEDLPLTILIKAASNEIIVSNNLQPRNTKEALSGTGLQNIKDRYK